MADCYSIRACKQNRYIVDVDGDKVILGHEKNRLIFYDENDAENYRALCDDTMDDCFQIMVEKESKAHLIERIILSDEAKPYGTKSQNSDTVLADILKPVDFEISGIAHKIFKIYGTTSDKKSVEAMFEAFTGVSFAEYLGKCEATIDV